MEGEEAYNWTQLNTAVSFIKMWLQEFTTMDKVTQGIIDINRNGNLANFFSHVCNGKKSKELFASTLNRIPASVRYVSSIIVVINAKFVQLLAAHANKQDGEKRKSPTKTPCFAS